MGEIILKTITDITTILFFVFAILGNVFILAFSIFSIYYYLNRKIKAYKLRKKHGN